MTLNTISGDDWPEVRFRYLADFQKGGLPSSEIELHPDAESAPYLTMEYLRGETIEPNLVTVDPSALMASEQSILLLWDGSNAGEFLRAKQGVVSSTSALVTPKSVDPTYFYWACKSQEGRVRAETVGMGIPHVNGEFLANIRIRLPSLPQQRAIAEYLDRETTRLDALMAEKERMLVLLSEKRQALITKAVTMLTEESQNGYETDRARIYAPAAGRDGVNRYSNAHCRRLKYAATINDEVLNENTDDDYKLQYIDIGNIYASGSTLEPVTYQFKDAPSRARRRVREGDIIISCVRTYLQAIAQIQNPPANLVVSTGFAVVRPSVAFLNPNFANYAFRNPSFLAEIEKRSIGVSYPAINASDLADISIHLPPLREQRSVADYLDRKTTRLDSLVVEIKVTISLLKERRAALIATVVNGHHDIGKAA